jgi:hypothetical protein
MPRGRPQKQDVTELMGEVAAMHVHDLLVWRSPRAASLAERLSYYMKTHQPIKLRYILHNNVLYIVRVE